MGSFNVIRLIWLSGICTAVFSQQNNLQFTNTMHDYNISENTQVGTLIFTLQASDGSGSLSNLQFSISSPNNDFEIRNATTGEVYLAQALDYEMYTTINVTMSVTNGSDTVHQLGLINVMDVNDAAPYFTMDIYDTVTVSENTGINFVVFRNLTVQDPDTVNTILNVECVVSTDQKYQGACDTFVLVPRESTERVWRGDIALKQTLNAEVKNLYYILIRAFDGVLGNSNIATKEITVRVSDIQDTPPIWQPSQSPTVTILEETAVGSSILNISAADGDITNKRAVNLTLIGNPDQLFKVVSVDSGFGNIMADQPIIAAGLVELIIQACEILANGQESTNVVDCSRATVVVVIQDINNNIPTFDKPVYDVKIPENIADNTPLPNLIVIVNDQDQGNNAKFELIMEMHTDIFSVMPSIGTNDLTASIYVTNSSTLDYESFNKVYTIPLIARETNTPQLYSSSALITVELTDVNDNPPTFNQSSYSASVSETAPSATPVIKITATDRDSTRNGAASLWYKLIGNGADKFFCNIQTGQVTVASCATPGSGNCLNAEDTSLYSLTFVVADRYGEGYIISVPLTVTVNDVNDNPPRFTVPNIVSFITEGETIPDPTIQVNAIDPDQNPMISYSIVGGNIDVNGSPLWQIGNTTGVIDAVTPVDFETIPGNTGRYVLTVIANDGVFEVAAEVSINVIDTNDHAPVFDVLNYYQEILETTPPGTFIEQVSATDSDPSNMPSGQISYRIIAGGQDQFALNSTTGDITVADGITFDYNIQNRYDMQVIAVDQGSPQKSATATVVIAIRDVNNKNPFFQPSTVRESIREDAPISTPVITMKATDLDTNSSLIYFLEEPIVAYDPTDQVVIPQTPEIKAMFSIDRLTGVIKVNQTLSYDKVARYQAIVKARDNAGQTDQTATATIIIDILEINKRPPVFGDPWSVNNPFINITANEEQPQGTYVTTLVATDATDAIQEYKIIYDPGNHFMIDPNTGTVSIKTPLDYETEESTRLTVVAIDSGDPTLTATATVLVAINNLNDETPTFGTLSYDVQLIENAPNGTFVVSVSAIDKDKGDYGIVKYSLDDPLNRFTINPENGYVTVLPEAVLDREKEPTITLTATAYDSPNNPDVRRYAKIPIYITLLDRNDQSPSFPQKEYIAVILENVPAGTSVVQVGANDKDAEGPNSRLTYYELNGDPFEIFIINPVTGLITTNGSLIGYSGIYNITVGVSDSGSPIPKTGSTQANIRVLRANNGPPRWILPGTTNQTVKVIEETYLGEEVYDAYAEDRDPGKNGEVEYGFSYKNQFVTETPEFAINPLTGQITARVKFDRENVDHYILQLVATDKGDPPFVSEIYLFIQITDVNDNRPEFPQYYNCCTIPYTFSIYEDVPTDSMLGTVHANDTDVGSNAEVFYSIMSGNTNEAFSIGPFTGILTVNKELDHERQNFYQLTIQAVDYNGADASPEIGPNCRCSDPTRVLLNVHILDRNDFPPTFAVAQYHACVAVDAKIGKRVTVMEAIDNDSGTSKGVRYKITSSNNYNSIDANDQTIAPDDSFIISQTNGSVYSNTLMDQYSDHYFVVGVEALDVDNKSAETRLYVWVTESDQEIVMTSDRPIDEVRKDLDDIILEISRLTNNGIVCVGDLSYHLTDNNLINTDMTDLIFHIINNETLVIVPVGQVIGQLEGNMAAFGMVGIVASYSYWDGFIIDPVLAAVIVILILLLIALLLLCCLCWCLGALAGKRSTYMAEEKPLYLGTINPLWGHKFSEDQELTMTVKEYEIIEPSFGTNNPAFEGDFLDTAGAIQTSEFYQYKSSNQMSTETRGMSNGQLSPSGVRIEAPLETGEASDGIYIAKGQYTDYSDAMHHNLVSTATMTEDGRSDLGSARYVSSQKVGFGATLTRPDHQQERVISDSFSDFGEIRTQGTSGSTTRYRLYTGSQTLPPQFGNQYSTLLSSEDISSPDVFIVNDQSTYQGEIHVSGVHRF